VQQKFLNHNATIHLPFFHYTHQYDSIIAAVLKPQLLPDEPIGSLEEKLFQLMRNQPFSIRLVV
jgi:hypothetical protein